MENKKSIIFGILGGAVLLLIYFGILTVANSFAHAVDQFIYMWYWISLLVVGFGIQVGLFSYIRTAMHAKLAGATEEIAAAGGVSTGSMIACCAHHVTDILPLIGLSAASLFLVRYQVPFMILGILSNLVGIIMMLSIIQKHKLTSKKSIFTRLFRYNMKVVRNIVIFISAAVVSAVFINAAFFTG